MLTALDAPDDALDKFERPFVASIRDHGWYRTNVAEEGVEPGCSYTTGFWSSTGQPERLMFGMKSSVHDIFWDLFRDGQRGIALPICRRCDQVFGNMPAYVFPVSLLHYRAHPGWSRWFYGGDDFPCLQIVWPDREGVFPWQANFDPAFANRQADLTERGWLASVVD